MTETTGCFTWLDPKSKKYIISYHHWPKMKRGPLANSIIPFEQSEYEISVKRLQLFFAPKRNAAFERHIFRCMKQEEHERIDVFAMRLRAQADKCDFNEQIDENTKEQISFGTTSE